MHGPRPEVVDWDEGFSSDGNFMTQFDVDGGRTLTVASISSTKTKSKTKTRVMHWVEPVLPWLICKGEGRLLGHLGWSSRTIVGKRLFLDRDPSVEAFGKVAGGARIYGSPDIPEDIHVEWRIGKAKLKRTIRRTEDPDPLWGLVVVRLGLPLDVVEGWAASKGRPLKLSQMNQVQRAQVAAKLDTEENRAALVAFANNQQKKDGE